jgi:hypothetical protein
LTHHLRWLNVMTVKVQLQEIQPGIVPVRKTFGISAYTSSELRRRIRAGSPAATLVVCLDISPNIENISLTCQ